MKVNYTLFIILFYCLNLNAADYYWVGGSGIWDDYLNHWATTSGGSVYHTATPGPNDNVYFDENSFPTTGQFVRIQSLNTSCKSMNWENATNSPKLIVSPAIPVHIYGSLILNLDMFVESTTNILWKFYGTSPGNIITTAGHELGHVVLDGQGGGWALQDSLTGKKIEHIEGVFDTNSNSITVNEFSVDFFRPRTLMLRNSVIVCHQKWEAAPSALTFMPGSSSIYTPDFQSSAIYYSNVFITTPLIGNSFIRGNGNTFGQLSFVSEALSEVRGSHSVDDMLSFSSPNAKILFEDTKTFYIGDYGSIRTFMPCGGLAYLSTITEGGTFYFNKNAGPINIGIELKKARLKGIHTQGSAIFRARYSVDEGGNSGWNFQNNLTSKTLYWVGGTGAWEDGSHWSLTSGGNGNNCMPSILDNVIFDDNSFVSSNDVVTVDSRNLGIHDMDWTNTLFVPDFNLVGSNNLKSFEISGSLNFTDNVSVTDFGTNWIFNSDESNTITTGGNGLNTMTFANSNGSWTIKDDLMLFSNLNHNAGHLNTNDKTLDVLNFFSGYNSSRMLTFGNSKIRAVANIKISESNLILDAGTSLLRAPMLEAFNLNLHDVYIYSPLGTGLLIGNNLTLNRLKVNTGYPTTIGGSHTYNGNMIIEQAGAKVIFYGGSVQTLNGTLIVSTDCVQMTTIESNNNTNVEFIKTDGSIVVFNVDFRYVTAAGNAFLLAMNSSYFPSSELPNSGWLFANGNCALPIELTAFNATKNNRVVDLDWTSELEVDASHYLIERSTTGNEYVTIGKVLAVGNSVEQNSYQFTDENPMNGDNYYRLKMVNLDGSFDFSEVRTIRFDYSIEEMITIYPNPMVSNINLEIKLSEEAKVFIKIVDMQGRVVHQPEVTSMLPGSYKLNYELEATLTDGMYFFDIVINDLQTRRKFVKLSN